MEFIVSYLPLFGILALIFVFVKNAWVAKQEEGDEKMSRIAKNIADGAMSFLKAEYKILSIFVIAVAVLLYRVLRPPRPRPEGEPPDREPGDVPSLVPLPPVRLIRMWLTEGQSGTGRRISDAEPLQAGAPYCRGEIAQQIAVRPHGHAIPLALIGARCRPQTVAVVMFAGEHHVARARPNKKRCPFVRIEQFGPEKRSKIPVLEILTVNAAVKLMTTVHRVVYHAGVIPLCVGCVAPLGKRAPSRYGVNSPVNEDPEFRFIEPSRYRPGIE